MVIGGGSLAYAAYQAPEMVIGQALGSTFAQANPSFTLDLSSDNTDLGGTATLDVATAPIGSKLSLKLAGKYMGSDIGATLNVLAAKTGNYYLNLEKFDSLAKYLLSTGMVSQMEIDAYSKLLKGAWISVSKTDLTNASIDNPCVTEKFNNPTYLKTLQSKMGLILRDNNFIVAKNELAGINGDRVFEMTISADKLKKFIMALKTTPYIADFKSCNPTFELDMTTVNAINQKEIDAWFSDNGVTWTLQANGFSHNLTKMSLDIKKGTTSGHLTYVPTGDRSSTVKMPTKFVTFSEFFNQLLMYPY